MRKRKKKPSKESFSGRGANKMSRCCNLLRRGNMDWAIFLPEVSFQSNLISKVKLWFCVYNSCHTAILSWFLLIFLLLFSTENFLRIYCGRKFRLKSSPPGAHSLLWTQGESNHCCSGLVCSQGVIGSGGWAKISKGSKRSATVWLISTQASMPSTTCKQFQTLRPGHFTCLRFLAWDN